MGPERISGSRTWSYSREMSLTVFRLEGIKAWIANQIISLTNYVIAWRGNERKKRNEQSEQVMYEEGLGDWGRNGIGKGSEEALKTSSVPMKDGRRTLKIAVKVTEPCIQQGHYLMGDLHPTLLLRYKYLANLGLGWARWRSDVVAVDCFTGPDAAASTVFAATATVTRVLCTRFSTRGLDRGVRKRQIMHLHLHIWYVATTSGKKRAVTTVSYRMNCGAFFIFGYPSFFVRCLRPSNYSLISFFFSFPLLIVLSVLLYYIIFVLSPIISFLIVLNRFACISVKNEKFRRFKNSQSKSALF